MCQTKCTFPINIGDHMVDSSTKSVSNPKYRQNKIQKRRNGENHTHRRNLIDYVVIQNTLDFMALSHFTYTYFLQRDTSFSFRFGHNLRMSCCV